MLDFWKFFFAFGSVQGRLCRRCARRLVHFGLSSQRYRVGCSRTWSFARVSKCVHRSECRAVFSEAWVSNFVDIQDRLILT